MTVENKFVDLHTHSTASDGSSPPGELIRLAREQHLAAVALTDHDTIAGIDEFLAASKDSGVIAVPGVEISTSFDKRELHIVGLFIDQHNLPLNNFLNYIRKKRDARNARIIAKLQNRGYDITLADAAALAGGDVIGRPHIAKVLIEKYEFASIQEVFDKLLKKGRPAYSPREVTTPAEAIEHIHRAHGVAVWAHPIFRQANEYQWCRKAIKYLRSAKLDALEVYYSSFNTEQSAYLLERAEEFDLAPSGGSDFHGFAHGEIQMGVGNGGLRVPYEFYERLRALAEKYR